MVVSIVMEKLRHSNDIFSFDKIIKLVFIIILLTPLVFSFHLTTYRIPKIYFSRFFILLVFLIWLGRMILTKQWHLKKSHLTIPVVLYLIWSTLTLTKAVNKYEGINSLYHLASMVMLYFVVLNNVHNHWDSYQCVDYFFLYAVFLY